MYNLENVGCVGCVGSFQLSPENIFNIHSLLKKKFETTLHHTFIHYDTLLSNIYLYQNDIKIQ